ncbi:hypothetical protein IFM89_030474 [Coptis chinensis]|uniref:Uncharacterized protein n=1 Tax=Coptis chinensis TaxID=261450 RepID=A0A835H8L4_9MAGN|nr:hypothetical protein IFM89_030474 [Coptis chinensis]
MPLCILSCRNIGFSRVIANSISPLTPSDILKLLDFLISIVIKRYTVLQPQIQMFSDTDLLPFYLLSGYLFVLQIIESRVSTFQSALQLSSVLDYLFVGIYDDMADESNTFSPTIYEDKDESDEDEPVFGRKGVELHHTDVSSHFYRRYGHPSLAVCGVVLKPQGFMQSFDRR